jgi:CheY-like chemotaxis protein
MTTTTARMLIADDDYEFVQRATNSLSRDVEIRVATNGRQALHEIREWRPDVVVLDLLLHDIDGFALLDRLVRQESQPLPVILCSMHGGGADIRLPRSDLNWPVGTLSRTATSDRLRSTILSVLSARYLPSRLN